MNSERNPHTYKKYRVFQNSSNRKWLKRGNSNYRCELRKAISDGSDVVLSRKCCGSRNNWNSPKDGHIVYNLHKLDVCNEYVKLFIRKRLIAERCVSKKIKHGKWKPSYSDA